MNRFFKTTGVIGALMVSLPAVVGFAGVAHAAEHVQFSDLKLSTANDARIFKARADAAARRFCAGELGRASLSDISACRTAVLEEIGDQLTPEQRVALNAAAGTKVQVASTDLAIPAR